MTIENVKNNFVQNLAENAYINMCSVEEMNIAIKALEKQIPKKPIVNSEIYHYVDYEELFCPCCKSRIIARLDGEFIAGKKQKYCHECGQALDWSE